MKKYSDMDALGEYLAAEGIKFDRAVPLSEHTTARVGGTADYAIYPSNPAELVKAVNFSDENGVKRTVIGKGSDILVSDSGYRGAAIFTQNLSRVEIVDDKVLAGAGASLSSLCSFFCENGLVGAEFTVGIPGSVGGGIVTNCGCFGSEISSLVHSVTAFDGRETMEIKAEDLRFSYRGSALKGSDKIVISALFHAKTGVKDEIGRKIDGMRKLRRNKPRGFGMGSIFKNGEFPAGLLIDGAGLKGFRVGGAYVSEEHANYFLNDGTASASDFYALIKTVKALVYERVGARLEEEIVYIGEFD